MTLPILLSVPHAGLRVPPEAEPYCMLSEEEIIRDGDEGAAEIYDLSEHVAEFVTTDVAREIVNLNRAEDDRRKDGIVKTHTCWDVPVYREPLPDDVIEALLARYHRPYHARLSELAHQKPKRKRGTSADDAATRDPSLARRAGVLSPTSPPILLAVDCHTMAAVAPPVAPDPGRPRPAVCPGDVNGQTLPVGWINKLHACFSRAFDDDVTVNEPFAGGYITRTHGHEMPWLQLELSRGDFLTSEEKRARVLAALMEFCREK